MTSAQPKSTATNASCVHHWVIEAPNGRESHGVCRRCGHERSFANSTENVMWEHTNTLRSTPGSGLRSIPRPSEVRLSDEVVD